uniref:Uncharacterized protein n=1 Tax=viral metagenome TaxID=1070528 RepID=A0A6C0KHZ4_9ZZZZ
MPTYDVSNLAVFPRNESILVKWDGFEDKDSGDVSAGGAKADELGGSQALLGNIAIDLIDPSLNKSTQVVYKSAVPFDKDASSLNVNQYLFTGLTAGTKYDVVLRANVDFNGVPNSTTGDLDLKHIMDSDLSGVPYTSPSVLDEDDIELKNDLSGHIMVFLKKGKQLFESSANLLEEVGYNALDSIRFELTETATSTVTRTTFTADDVCGNNSDFPGLIASTVVGDTFSTLDGTDSSATFIASINKSYTLQAFAMNDTLDEIAGAVLTFEPTNVTTPLSLTAAQTGVNELKIRATNGDAMSDFISQMKVILEGKTTYGGSFVEFLAPNKTRSNGTTSRGGTPMTATGSKDHYLTLTVSDLQNYKTVKVRAFHYTDAEDGSERTYELPIIPSASALSVESDTFRMNYVLEDGVERRTESGNLLIDNSFNVEQTWWSDLSGEVARINALADHNTALFVSVKTYIQPQNDPSYSLASTDLSWGVKFGDVNTGATMDSSYSLTNAGTKLGANNMYGYVRLAAGDTNEVFTAFDQDGAGDQTLANAQNNIADVSFQLTENTKVKVTQQIVVGISYDEANGKDLSLSDAYHLVKYVVDEFTIPSLPTFDGSFTLVQDELNTKITIPAHTYTPYTGGSSAPIKYIMHKHVENGTSDDYSFTNGTWTTLSAEDISNVIAGESSRFEITNNAFTDSLTYTTDNRFNVYYYTLLPYVDVTDPTSGSVFRMYGSETDAQGGLTQFGTQPFILPAFSNIKYNTSTKIVSSTITNHASFPDNILDGEISYNVKIEELGNSAVSELYEILPSRVSIDNSGNLQLTMSTDDISADKGYNIYLYSQQDLETSGGITGSELVTYVDVSHDSYGTTAVPGSGVIYGEIIAPLGSKWHKIVQIPSELFTPGSATSSDTSLKNEIIEDSGSPGQAIGLTGSMVVAWDACANFMSNIDIYRQNDTTYWYRVPKNSAGAYDSSGEVVDSSPTDAEAGQVGVSVNDITYYKAVVDFADGTSHTFFSDSRKLLGKLDANKVGLKEVSLDVCANTGEFLVDYIMHPMPADYDVSISVWGPGISGGVAAESGDYLEASGNSMGLVTVNGAVTSGKYTKKDMEYVFRMRKLDPNKPSHFKYSSTPERSTLGSAPGARPYDANEGRHYLFRSISGDGQGDFRNLSGGTIEGISGAWYSGAKAGDSTKSELLFKRPEFSSHKVVVEISPWANSGTKSTITGPWKKRTHTVSNHIIPDLSNLVVQAIQTDNDVTDNELTYVKFDNKVIYDGVSGMYFPSATGDASQFITEEWSKGTYLNESGPFQIGYAVSDMSYNDVKDGPGLQITRPNAALKTVDPPANNSSYPPVRDLEVKFNYDIGGGVEKDVLYWTAPLGRTPLYFDVKVKSVDGFEGSDNSIVTSDNYPELSFNNVPWRVPYTAPGPYVVRLDIAGLWKGTPAQNAPTTTDISGPNPGDQFVVRAAYSLNDDDANSLSIIENDSTYTPADSYSVRSLVEYIAKAAPNPPTNLQLKELTPTKFVLSVDAHDPSDGFDYDNVECELNLYEFDKAATSEENIAEKYGATQTFQSSSFSNMEYTHTIPDSLKQDPFFILATFKNSNGYSNVTTGPTEASAGNINFFPNTQKVFFNYSPVDHSSMNLVLDEASDGLKVRISNTPYDEDVSEIRFRIYKGGVEIGANRAENIENVDASWAWNTSDFQQVSGAPNSDGGKLQFVDDIGNTIQVSDNFDYQQTFELEAEYIFKDVSSDGIYPAGTDRPETKTPKATFVLGEKLTNDIVYTHNFTSLIVEASGLSVGSQNKKYAQPVDKLVAVIQYNTDQGEGVFVKTVDVNKSRGDDFEDISFDLTSELAAVGGTSAKIDTTGHIFIYTNKYGTRVDRPVAGATDSNVFQDGDGWTGRFNPAGTYAPSGSQV